MRLRVDPPELRNHLLEHLRASGCLAVKHGTDELEAQRPVWRGYHILSALGSGDADTHAASVHIYDRDGVWVSSLHPSIDLTPDNFAHDIRLALRSS